MKYFNVGNEFANKSQDLEYIIDLVLNLLCIIARKLDSLAGSQKSQDFENSNKAKIKN
jgi:hypothetical protein